ncbi:hypothetical protein AB6A40_009803 [Gnathostoma spinigerum]|uniref:Thyrotropin-releasing hormone receptor n=1 Tax=Gnathostoma spinigerum TaxID=75299 RepID=A0ABD6EY66_9BILA
MFLYIFVYSRIICTLKQSSEKEVPSIVHHNSKDARIQDSYMQLTQSSTSLLGGGVTKSRQPSMNVSRKSRRKGGNQVVKMLAIVVFVFAICWLPYRSMVAYNSFAVVKWDPDWYIYFSKTMIFINCAINPILYNVMSARFRRAFRQLFKCDGHKRICKNTAKEFSATTPIIRVDRETRATTDSEPKHIHFDFASLISPYHRIRAPEFRLPETIFVQM